MVQRKSKCGYEREEFLASRKGRNISVKQYNDAVCFNRGLYIGLGHSSELYGCSVTLLLVEKLRAIWKVGIVPTSLLASLYPY